MGKPTICLGKNKDADQLCSNCTADHRLCFCYTDSTVPLLLKSDISSFWPASVIVQAGLCHTWSEPKLLVLSRTGSFHIHRLRGYRDKHVFHVHISITLGTGQEMTLTLITSNCIPSLVVCFCQLSGLRMQYFPKYP